MRVNESITQVVSKVISTEIRLMYETTPGMCLAVTRQVIEKALNKPPHWLYQNYVTSWVAPTDYDRIHGHWARDFERDAKRLGWAIPINNRQPGDIIFNWRAAYSDRYNDYIGHVGILWKDDLIFENIEPGYRPISFQRKALSLTPFGDWPVTLVARIPEEVLKEAT